jgi:hypothetical protein
MKLLFMLVVLFISEYLRIEREKKIRLEKRINLMKVKSEIEVQRKKEQFEAFRKYIEDKYKEEPKKEVIKSDKKKISKVVYLETGVKKLRDNGHKYVPYERANPLDDIRSSLSEFTVSDVLNTFYTYH